MHLNLRRNFVINTFLILCFCSFCLNISKVYADEDALYALCNKLDDLKRYEGKRIGYDNTESSAWQLGELIVAYGKDAIPYLKDVYENSDNLIAQLFAARLVGEIDFEKGIKMLENFLEDRRLIDTLFGTERTTMTVEDVAKKEIMIIKKQEKKSRSMQDVSEVVISSQEQ